MIRKRSELYPRMLILGSLVSMEESKKVSDSYQYSRTVHKIVSKIFLQSHENLMSRISLVLVSIQHHVVGSVKFDLN